MNIENKRVEKLLEMWCEEMLALQIPDSAPEGLRGGILCPACARVHGRSLDALYPFLYMADKTENKKWVDAAKKLFDWSEHSVSQPDGSFACDTNNAWFGITVFSVIQMCEVLIYHGKVVDEDTKICWKNRVKKAADFLLEFTPVYHHNVNYRFANALAMQLCGELFHDEKYYQKAEECAEQFERYLTENLLLFGEGVPTDAESAHGCRAIDIGYNVEESLPSLAQYAMHAHNRELEDKVADSIAAHVKFMLPDGAWDNSFGTRNYKWSYWGSRTSDGCMVGCLLAAGRHPECLSAAQKNFELLEKCTHNGLLYGGVNYFEIGERPCVHHTFTHAKVLTAMLDQGLSLEGEAAELPRMNQELLCYYPEIDTFILQSGGTAATISNYDWEYIKGGHACGGNLTMLWQEDSGVLFCGTMNEYHMHGPNNQQLPHFPFHECLTPRLEYVEHGIWYTSLYDMKASITHENGTVMARGEVRSREGCVPEGELHHKTQYCVVPSGIEIDLQLDRNQGVFVCPIVSLANEPVHVGDHDIEIEKADCTVRLIVKVGKIQLPYGIQRCYNLVGGFQALRVNISPTNKCIRLKLEVIKKE